MLNPFAKDTILIMKRKNCFSAQLTLEGQEWRERRTKLSPVFTSGKMKMMFDIVNSIGDKFVGATDKAISQTSIVEVREMLAKFTTDVISNVAFGLDSKCKMGPEAKGLMDRIDRQNVNINKICLILLNEIGLEDPDSEFFKHGQRLFNLTSLEFMKFFFTATCPDLARKLHMRANVKEPCDFLQKVFTQTIRERESSNIERNDFVQLLMKLRETSSLTVDEMAAESFIFFTGG